MDIHGPVPGRSRSPYSLLMLVLSACDIVAIAASALVAVAVAVVVAAAAAAFAAAASSVAAAATPYEECGLVQHFAQLPRHFCS